MPEVNFSMTIKSKYDFDVAIEFIRPMLENENPMTLSLTTKKQKGRPFGRPLSPSLKDRVEASINNAQEEISKSVLKNKLRCDQEELDAALLELANEGKITKNLGRFYGGGQVEKWKANT